MSLASKYQKQISALPAPPLLHDSSNGEIKTALSLEPNFFLLTPDAAELGTETESEFAHKSQLLGSYDDSYDESYDESYDDSYDEPYDDLFDAPAASVTGPSVAPQAALDELLAPIRPSTEVPQRQSLPKTELKTKDRLEEMKKTLLQVGREAYSWNVSVFNSISDLSFMFIYFLLVDGKSADVRIQHSNLDLSLLDLWL